MHRSERRVATRALVSVLLSLARVYDCCKVLGMDSQEASQHGLGAFEEEASTSGQGAFYCQGEEHYAFTEGTGSGQEICGKVSQDVPTSGCKKRCGS